MGTLLRVLIVEDSQSAAGAIVDLLRKGGYDLAFERVDTFAAFTAALDREHWDIVFSGFAMRGFSGMDALALVKKRGGDLPFIFVAEKVDIETAVEAIKAGAQDYILSNNLKRLLPIVESHLRKLAVPHLNKRNEETLYHLAYHDALTDLPNRIVFNDRLQQGILSGLREQKVLALLLMDLNRFKAVNDTFGHPCGDLLLREIGPRVRPCLRESDTLARMSGDEFAVLLPNTDLGGAERTARKILKSLVPAFEIKDATVEIGASIGIAKYPDHGRDAETLFLRADNALYAAKQAGGGYKVYAPRYDRKSSRQLSLTGKSHNGDRA